MSAPNPFRETQGPATSSGTRYYFVKWLMPGGSEPADNPVTIQTSDDKSITAVYAARTSNTIVVNTIEDVVNPDDGVTSLREAVQQANGSAGDDNINFNIINGPSGSKIISLLAPLPPFTDRVFLDFSDQVDGSGNPLISLTPAYNPAAYPGQIDGIVLSGDFQRAGYVPSGSVIRGLDIHGFAGSGICLHSDNNLVQLCYVHDNGNDGVCISDGNGNSIGDTYASGAHERGRHLRGERRRHRAAPREQRRPRELDL
jgi:CSLREA domain-containing protein